MRVYFITLFFLCSLTSLGFSQTQIKGKVIDSKTGEGLASAHVIIKGTYNGTIANTDGEFSITVKSLPAIILVRFLGFETQEKIIESYSGESIRFSMNEAVVQMQPLIVGKEDPAIGIMHQVIANKKIWRQKLDTYKAEAYTRQQLKNDTSIVSISESISEVFWDKEKGSREVLKSRRQTANIEGASNFAGVRYLPNFYNDRLDIAGFEVVGITSDEALSFYDFKLRDYKSIDDKVVYEIQVIAKRKLQPLFEGTIFVLDEDFALLSVDLVPNNVIVFPPPIQQFNLAYKQQFSNYGGDFWLPVDVRIDGLIEVGVMGLRFPPIGFSQVSKLTNYQVNIELPDSLYKNNMMIRVDSTTINKTDSMFVTVSDAVPLSEVETKAYESIDSTASLEKAFKPKGFLTRFIDFDEEEGNNSITISSSDAESNNSNTSRPITQSSSQNSFLNNLSYDARYNRVDAIYLGLNHQRRYLKNKLSTTLGIGYSLGYEELSYKGRLNVWPLKNTRRLTTYLGYTANTQSSYSSNLYSLQVTSSLPLFGYDDYFNYFREEGAYLGIVYRSRDFSKLLRLEYHLKEHSSINYSQSYDLLGRDNLQRVNPNIEDGTLSSFVLTLSGGEGKNGFGAIPADDFKFSLEQSLEALGSDWSFTKFEIDLFRRYETFYKKRFFPNTLDFRINAGTYLGDLPVQKYGTIDAALGYFKPFGAFKSQLYIPYQGGSYFAINAEHNFKSVPLEILGWRNAPQTGLSIIAFGGIGRTWSPDSKSTLYLIPQMNNYHSEVGISLSNIFSLFRFDLAYRIDDSGFYPGLSFARLF